MSEPLTIGSSQGTLGDSLWITPIFRSFPGTTLRLFDTPSCHNVAQIYEGLVREVQFVEQPGVPPTMDAPTHVTQRMLAAMGRPDDSIIPWVVLREDEIAWARWFLVQQGFPDLTRLLVIHTHNSGWADPSNWFARHVKPPKPIMQTLADVARSDGYTVLQFCNAPHAGKPDNFDPLTGTHHIRGLTLRQTAACYHVIGRLISGDTGDPYLALAAGARVVFLMCPELEQTGYRHFNVQYTDALWKGEKPRTRYHEFKDWQRVADDLAFDW